MRKIVFLLLLLSLSKLSIGQQSKVEPLNLGITHEIWSAQLSESRKLNIYLPEGYNADSATRYPVIYLLDGSANEDFIHIMGLVQFLTMIEAMPKSILVGIANVDRRRDFTFPTTIAADKKDYPTTGSSKRFIGFLGTELQPFVAKNYKTTDDRTIIGQSLGGLLATEVLIKQPQLFNQYIIISPSLWWDKESLLNETSGIAKTANNTKVFLAVGTEGKQMEEDAKAMAGVLKKHTAIQSWFRFMPEEDHLTILHNATYQAFKQLYLKKGK